MKTEKIFGRGITGLDIRNLNMVEVRQMMNMKERIAHVLDTHCDEKTKNEYLKDDELELLHAILHVFTRDVELETTSAFDEALKELKSPEPAPSIPKDDDLFGGDN